MPENAERAYTISYCSAVLKSLEKGVPVVSVSMAGQSGSAPRSAGARMLVYPDGKVWGTVGGGRYEGEAIKAAQELLHSSQAQENFPALLLGFSLQDVRDMDMICGGNVLLLLEVFFPTKENLTFFSHTSCLEKKAIPFCLAAKLDFTEIPRGTGRQTGFSKRFFLPLHTHFTLNREAHCQTASTALSAMCVNNVCEKTESHAEQPFDKLEYDESIPNSIKKQIVEYIKVDGVPFSLVSDSGHWFIEPFLPGAQLRIFGAGHVSRALATVAHTLGYSCTVVDDRPEFANQARFPTSRVLAHSLSTKDIEAFLQKEPLTAKDAVVIVTRGHADDKNVLAAVLRSNAGYIGMIGSRSKRTHVYARLREEGFCDEDFARVHCPIGLDIGAETPEEIAISIAAELICWFRKGVSLQKAMWVEENSV